MTSAFNIYQKLQDGTVLYVLWRANQLQAEQLARDLGDRWPGEFGIEAADEPVYRLPMRARWHN